MYYEIFFIFLGCYIMKWNYEIFLLGLEMICFKCVLFLMMLDFVKFSVILLFIIFRCYIKLGMKEDGRNREGRFGERDVV